MGYLTTFHIDISDSEYEHAIGEWIHANDPDSYLDLLWKYGGEEWKWYDHEVDMRALSLAWPAITFTMRGNGEDNDDMWVEYYLGGLMQREVAQITYAPFDRAKLS